MVQLARDYSRKRVCFGKKIKDHKLHVKNLAHMEVGSILYHLWLRGYRLK